MTQKNNLRLAWELSKAGPALNAQQRASEAKAFPHRAPTWSLTWTAFADLLTCRPRLCNATQKGPLRTQVVSAAGPCSARSTSRPCSCADGTRARD